MDVRFEGGVCLIGKSGMGRETLAGFLALVVCTFTFAEVQPDADTFMQPDDEYVLSGEWMKFLSEDDRNRLEDHVGGIPTHPMLTSTAMGVIYPPVANLPLATFHDELAPLVGDRLSAGEALVELFNVQLVSTEYRIDLPSSTELHIELSKLGRVRAFVVPMTLREGNVYYVADPSSTVSEFVEAVSYLGPFPRMSLSKLTGFVFDNSTIERMPPLGVAIIINVRIGSVRVDTGFQWAGRPRSIPINGGSYFLR